MREAFWSRLGQHFTPLTRGSWLLLTDSCTNGTCDGGGAVSQREKGVPLGAEGKKEGRLTQSKTSVHCTNFLLFLHPVTVFFSLLFYSEFSALLLLVTVLGLAANNRLCVIELMGFQCLGGSNLYFDDLMRMPSAQVVELQHVHQFFNTRSAPCLSCFPRQ